MRALQAVVYQQNIKEINEANPGSDIHGILERVAYRLSSGDQQRDWEKAKAHLLHWADGKYADGPMVLPIELTREIIQIAHAIYVERDRDQGRKIGDGERNWFMALDAVAEEIMRR